MINTLIVGLGNIGFKYDKINPKKKLTHSSSILYNKNFRLIGGVDSKKNISNQFKKLYKAPIFNNLQLSLKKLNPELIIFTNQPSFKDLLYVSNNKNLKFILVEKPYIKSPSEIKNIIKKLKKKKIIFSLNFQRNFSKKYINLFDKINAGIIGNINKFFCFYNKSFITNGSHFLNLVTLYANKLNKVEKVNNSKENFKLKFNNCEVYFFKVNDTDYNNNSLTIFGDKGKIEISSRPEKCTVYKRKNDNLYKNYFILKKYKTFHLNEKEIQKPVLNNIYNVLKKKQKVLYSVKNMLKYYQIINKLNLK